MDWIGRFVAPYSPLAARSKATLLPIVAGSTAPAARPYPVGARSAHHGPCIWEIEPRFISKRELLITKLCSIWYHTMFWRTTGHFKISRMNAYDIENGLQSHTHEKKKVNLSSRGSRKQQKKATASHAVVFMPSPQRKKPNCHQQ